MSKEISFTAKAAGYVEVNYAERNENNEVTTRRIVNYAKDRLFIYLEDTNETFTIANGTLGGLYFAKNDVLAPDGSSYNTAKECFDAICEVIHS